ncbi:MAG: GNAT family N-acetyltransferase [bacterium]|nr:GNAT family N-acetyltransferase [bacterium]
MDKMQINIRPVENSDIGAIIDLSLSAWSPVYISFRNILGSDIYEAIWPDWQASKRKSIGKLAGGNASVFAFVAEFETTVVGFISCKLDTESKTGTVQYLAVHPDYQNRGIGTELNEFALSMMQQNGMAIAIAETGGDESHLPARISYEKAGYTGLPLVRYIKKL